MVHDFLASISGALAGAKIETADKLSCARDFMDSTSTSHIERID